MTPSTVCERLGRDIEAIGRADLPAEVREKAAMCVLDAMGLVFLGRDEDTAAKARALCVPAQGELSATLWATGQRVSWSDACLANGVGAHAHFHDDSDPSSWCHPGSLVVPAAVAATQLAGGSLDDLLRAIAVGYGVLHWLGAEEQVAHALIGRGVRTSPTLGALGAAAASASAMRLDAGRCAHALAMAASMTGGVLEPLRAGSDEWRIQNGNAARLGVTAALFARAGVQGALSAIEGGRGMLRALAGLESEPAQWARPLDVRLILKSYAKPWATLGDNMAAVRAAWLMHGQGVDARRIVKAQVTLWHKYAEYPGTAYKGPFDKPIQALASTAFSTAGMLLLGDLEYDVPYGRRQDPDILRLVDGMEIVSTREGTKLDSTCMVWLDDGSRHVTQACDAPPTLLYHDRATALRLLDKRMAAAGAAGDWRPWAQALLDSGGGAESAADWLARLGDGVARA